LTHLLAAAGVVGIAIGFASQTSIANIISGLFLIAEESFVVGDVISVAYKENISKVREILFKVAHDNPLCLQNPEPVFLFREFGDSSINLLFAAWTLKSDFAELKNQLQEQVKVRFEEEGIEIPFPHVSIYKGAVSEPFPVELVENATPAKPGA
jgi:small-conductance mechanosensitive channel